MEYIVIVWIVIFLWGLLSLLGLLNNDNDARWVVSTRISCLVFIAYSAIITVVAVIKFVWTHLPGGA